MVNVKQVANSAIDKALSYTSGGNKFVYHPKEITNFLNNNGKSIISAHIAPTNTCNLHCNYCNQENRLKGAELTLDTIKNFVDTLMERALKAVIVTGGGEPTLYKHFNELVKWLKSKNLSVALITNGTNNRAGRENIDTWDLFSWIRVSLNFLRGKLASVKIPTNVNDNIGFSMVYKNQTLDMFKEVADIAEKYNARYVRVLPDCCTTSEQATKERSMLKELIDKLGYKRFFVQDKVPKPAQLSTCHQSKLRPFLLPDGKVAPCDCYMLNKNANGEYYKTLPDNFNLASDATNPSSYVDYLDGKFTPKYNPLIDCNNCSFTENNRILDDLLNLHKQYPDVDVNELFARIGQYPRKGVNDVDFV